MLIKRAFKNPTKVIFMKNERPKTIKILVAVACASVFPFIYLIGRMMTFWFVN